MARTIQKITLVFEPQDIEALSNKNSFAATYDTAQLNGSIGEKCEKSCRGA